MDNKEKDKKEKKKEKKDKKEKDKKKKKKDDSSSSAANGASKDQRRAERRARRAAKEKKKEEKEKKEKGAAAATTSTPAPPAASAAKPKVVDDVLGDGISKDDINSVFTFGKQLGSGAFSIVKEATNKKTADKVAVKIIKKTTVAGEDIKLLRREIANLKKLDHPNILKLFEVYEDKDNFFLVMELVRGKELFDKIVERGQYSERDASNITRQFVSAIEYLHNQGIAHRDLKPENLLSIGQGENEIIKVADFGLSKNFGDEKMMTSCGSPGYVAPEVLECESYDKAVDMWSIGVIIYILLVGYPPFYADNDPALFKKIMACDYDFGEGWDVISDGAKDLVRHLLVKDPKKRFTAAQTLNHPWVKQSAALSSKQLQMGKLKDFVTKKQFK